MKRAVGFILALACVACTDTLLGPAPKLDRTALFEQIWQQFDLHYSFFEYKNVNWDSVGAVYRPRALAAGTDQEFSAQIGGMLRELKDVHVSLTPAGAGSTLAYVSPFDTVPSYFSGPVVFQQYVPNARLTMGAHVKFGRAAANVGYIRIASFAGSGWAPEIDEALDSLKDVANVIVDVRNNRGGNIELAIKIAGRFLAKERTYAYVKLRNGPKHSDFTDYVAETVKPLGAAKFRGKVFLLTNRRDFSSAEDFVLAMRVIPRVTVVGDTTGGASGGPIPRVLANGWPYELSEWMEFTPAKKMFEGKGLAPDEYVKARARDAGDGVDAAMDRALRLAGGAK